MKSLHLLRHAKSDWKKSVPDRERGLNKRGKRDAPRMGAMLAQRLAPIPIHVSPARRAQLTLKGLCKGWPGLDTLKHRTEEALYTFDEQDLLQWLSGQPGKTEAIFVISHNPGLTELVNRLVGATVLDNLPTAGYVQLGLPIKHWRDLPRCEAVLEYSLFPRQLADN